MTPHVHGERGVTSCCSWDWTPSLMLAAAHPSPQELPVLEIPEDPAHPSVPLSVLQRVVQQLSFHWGVIWEWRGFFFFAFSKENQVPNPPLAVTGVVSSCCVQGFDPATHQDVFAEVLLPESRWSVCCRGKRNKPGEKMGPPQPSKPS